jgi:hypothetical protein
MVVAAACSGDDSAESSTTAAVSTTAAPVTSLADAGSTTSTTTTLPPSTSVTTTADPGDPVEFPGYTIVSREEGTSGDTVVVLLDTESYLSLTDIDLANVLADVVDRFPPVLTAYVVDDASAVDAVLAAEPTADQVAALDAHYFVRLEEGFRMVFTGKFSETPIAILGS